MPPWKRPSRPHASGRDAKRVLAQSQPFAASGTACVALGRGRAARGVIADGGEEWSKHYLRQEVRLRLGEAASSGAVAGEGAVIDRNMQRLVEADGETSPRLKNDEGRRWNGIRNRPIRSENDVGKVGRGSNCALRARRGARGKGARKRDGLPKALVDNLRICRRLRVPVFKHDESGRRVTTRHANPDAHREEGSRQRMGPRRAASGFATELVPQRGV